MTEETPPVTVAVSAPPATVTTTVVRRRSSKLLLLNIVNGAGTTILLVLAYLQTINLSAILTEKQALMWMVGINVLSIILRQFFSPPSVTETRVEGGGQP